MVRLRSALVPAVAFLVGAGAVLARGDAVTLSTGLDALVTGLAALVVARFAQRSAAEYRRRGGPTALLVFLGPLAAGAVAAAAVWVAGATPVSAFWAGFWTLAAAALVAVAATQFAAGYRGA